MLSGSRLDDFGTQLLQYVEAYEQYPAGFTVIMYMEVWRLSAATVYPSLQKYLLSIAQVWNLGLHNFEAVDTSYEYISSI